MIIDTLGNEIKRGFSELEGVVIRDEPSQNQYHELFSICVDYNSAQKEQYARIWSCKKALSETDYKAIKYSDGALTEEEYAPIRVQRAAWRAEINLIEETFSKPTLTREQIDEIERLAMEKLRKEDTDNGSSEDTALS